MSSSKVPAGGALSGRVGGGGQLRPEPGVHPAGLLLEANVELLGEPGVILDGQRRGSVLQVDADGLVVRLCDLTLRNGAAEVGGGLLVSGWSDVRLERCVIEGNTATLSGGGSGGGVYLHRGTLRMEACVIRDNIANSASALCITGAARAELCGGRVEGDIVLSEGAELTLDGVHVTGKVTARGTTTRAPTLILRGAQIDGGVENDVNLPAHVVVEAG